MNRYSGNSGIVERIPEPSERGRGAAGGAHYEAPSAPPPHTPAHYEAPRSTSPFGGFSLANLLTGNSENKTSEQSLFGGLGGLLSKFTKESLEMEDYLLLGVLYLLYRESGDIEFLLIAGAMLLL